MSKYKGIKFPFYGKLSAPVHTIYDYNTIYIIDKYGDKFLIDDKSINSSNYLKRLIKLEKNLYTIVYDHTAVNMSQLITSPIKWGLDNTGRIYDLSKKQLFKSMTVKIDKVYNNYLWAHKVSYPFKLEANQSQLFNKFIYITLVYIDSVWRLYQFGYKYHEKRDILL